MMASIPGTIFLAAAPGGSPLAPFLPMVIIFLIFYFLLIRPQQKRQKQHEAMVQGLEKGDRVTTAGGLRGTVVGVTDETLTLEIAALKSEHVRVEVSRNKIESVQKKESLQKKEKGGEAS